MIRFGVNFIKNTTNYGLSEGVDRGGVLISLATERMCLESEGLL